MRPFWARQELRIAVVAAVLFLAAAVAVALRTDAYHDLYPPETTTVGGRP